MARITLFAKGNLDIRDSLHSSRVGDQVAWNGVNEVLRSRYPGVLARLRHETYNRADALLAATGQVPGSLAERDLPLGAYPLESQFSTAVFDAPADAVILSVQPEMSTGLVRHAGEGYVFYPNGLQGWGEADRRWLKDTFEPSPPPSAEAAIANLRAVVERIRDRRDVPILVYNLSPVVPGETIHCLMGLGETFATRARRLNLGLAELSGELGISIVDVDTILARAGADALKLDPLHLVPEGNRLVAEEVVRILDDLGVLAAPG